ncbi:MAG: histidine kinase dimerization/phosphoacceptor domain-containing protein, partial [Pseudomonadota bacterium]
MNETARSADLSLLEKWQPFRGPFTRWPRLADTALAFVSLFLTLAIWSMEQAADDPPLAATAFVLFVLGNASLYWRRGYPERVHGIVLAASALVMALGHLNGPIFALGISLYNLGRYSADDRHSAAGLVAALALLLAGEFALGTFSVEDVFELLIPVGFWYAGRRIRRRGEYLRVLRERADQLEREQRVEAERAVAAERTRIARELHDVVAHQVSLMTVQAGAAKTVVATDSQAAADAMNSVEVAGRQALDELRHLLGVLRPDDDNGELEPQP